MNYLSMIGRRDKSLYVFGSWFGQKFADNPKYLFLYCLKKGLNAVWITKSETIFNQMRKDGYPVELAYSKNGEKLCKKAKYIFYCTALKDVNENCVGGATLINLWHGIPLKKIMYDDKINLVHNTKKAKIEQFLSSPLYKNRYVVSTSDTFSKIYEGAFRMNKRHILQWGQPRNDCFFDGSISKKKYSTIDYDKLVVYMPTHRNEGLTKISIADIFDLSKLNEFCQENKILFMIKKHFYHKHEEENLDAYSNIVDFTQTELDSQEVMFNADVLVSDYSSCYIDYMLLNRPTIFFAYDYNHYLAKDRGLYFNYDDVIPGERVTSFVDFLNALKRCFDGDTWKSRHMAIKDMFYSKENQAAVSSRIIKNLSLLK